MWRFLGRLLQRRNNNFVAIPLETRGNLYAGPMPYGPYDCFDTLLRSYKLHNVKRVLVLVTQDEIAQKARRDIFAEYKKARIAVVHFPINDLTCPFFDDFEPIVVRIADALKAGENVAVHCNAGVGRTCLVAGCMAVKLLGMTEKEAVEHVRKYTMVNLTTQQISLMAKFRALCMTDQKD
jgi:protein-tyrosine phosphatase